MRRVRERMEINAVAEMGANKIKSYEPYSDRHHELHGTLDRQRSHVAFLPAWRAGSLREANRPIHDIRSGR